MSGDGGQTPADRRYVETFGSPDDQAVILIPGAGFTRRVWRPHARRLAEEGYYAVAVDKPAHGRNPEEEFHMETAVEQVATIAQHLNEPVVVGHSAGGYVGLRAGNAVPAVDRVLSISGGYRFNEFPKGYLLSGLSGAVQLAVMPLLARIPVVSERLEAQTLDQLADEQYATDAEGEHDGGAPAVVRALLFSDTWPSELSVPTLILYGEDEPFLDMPRRLAARSDAAEFRTFCGGHQTPLTDPETVMPVVRAFIAEGED